MNSTIELERTTASAEPNTYAARPVTSETADRFSFVFQGPLYRFLLRLGLTQDRLSGAVIRAVLLVAVCWLPLLVLSFAQGESFNREIRIPFLFDFAASVRFLIALPILVLAEIPIDRRLRRVVQQFLRAGLVGAAELPSFEALLNKIDRLQNRFLPELVMLVIAYAPLLAPDLSDFYIRGVTTWHIAADGSGHRSYAGWWFLLVSAPLFRFLLLRWIWRFVLWTLFLRKVMRLRLHLVPSHPDLAAGLGFLKEAQKIFSLLVFAGGAVMSGAIANSILYESGTLASTRPLMITWIVIASLISLAPLLCATPLLVRARDQAIFEFGAMNAAHDQAFDARWIGHGAQPGAELLGNPDANSLRNLSHGYEMVHAMAPIPLDRRTLIVLAVAAALPMVPVFLIVTPVNELIRDVIKLLGLG